MKFRQIARQKANAAQPIARTTTSAFRFVSIEEVD
jgi:hypothetical protein